MRRGRSSVCGNAIKGTAEEKTGILLVKKSTETQQCIGHASERHSIGEGRIEDQMRSSNICGVWRVRI